MTNTQPTLFSEHRTPPFLRGTAIFSLLVSLFLAFISFMAWWVEDAAIGLWALPIWLAMALYWVRQGWIWARCFRLYDDRLEVIAPLTTPLSLAYDQITALEMEMGVVTLTTSQQTLRWRGDVSTLARLAAELDRRVPALRAATELPARLPIVIRTQWVPSLGMACVGGLLAALGVVMVYWGIDDVELENRTFLIGFGGLTFLIGGMPIYLLLHKFVWRYTFDRQRILVRHTLQTVEYNPKQLRLIEMRQEDQTHRGVTKRLYRLQLTFADHQTLLVEPGAQFAAFNYVEVYEKVILSKLLEQLQQAYGESMQTTESAMAAAATISPTPSPPAPSPLDLITRTEFDVNSLAWESSKKADYAYQLYSSPADLSVTILNYGERQPGAETVEIRLSRPVDGKDCFEITNGEAHFSKSGKLLLLHGYFVPILIDTTTMRAWHYSIPDRTFFLGASWEGETLLGKTLAYGKPMSEAKVFGPWNLADVEKEWETGMSDKMTG